MTASGGGVMRPGPALAEAQSDPSRPLAEILDLRRGGRVRRLHTCPTLREQTNADHSWGVAVLLDRLFGAPRELLVEALYHDVAEAETGDVPATAKWKRPALKAELDGAEVDARRTLGVARGEWLGPRHAEALALCDSLELMLFCFEDRRMGNRELEVVFDRLAARMSRETAAWERAGDVVLELIRAHDCARNGG